MPSEIKPDKLCIVVRNTADHPCVQAELGRPVTVAARVVVEDWKPIDAGEGIRGFSVSLAPGWTIKKPFRCARCNGLREVFLEADLQAIDGPGQGRDVPAEKPVVIGVDPGRPATADEAARMLEALR